MSNDVFRSSQGRDEVYRIYRELLALWPVPNKQYSVATRLGNTFVIESGDISAPALLLLHGSVSNSFAWLGDIALYSKTHHVFAIDLVGEAGFSAEARPAYGSGLYPEWLLDVVNALGIIRPAIVGLSLGGWMALAFAVKYPEQVSHLGLICPGGLGRQRLSLLPKVLCYSLLGAWGRRQITQMLYGGRVPVEGNLQRAMEITMTINRHFKPRTGFLPVFTPEELSGLQLPVMVLFGDRDAVLDGEGSLHYSRANIPDCQAILLQGTGHVIVDQAPRLAKFLASDQFQEKTPIEAVARI